MKSTRCQLLSVLLLAGLLLFSLQTAAFAAKAPAPAPVAPPAAPAPTAVVPIEIRAHAYDAIGTALIQRTTDIFANDRRFQLVTSSEPSRVIINVSTQASKSNKEPVTAYGLAVTFKLPSSVDRLFAGNTVGVCSMKEVPADAQGIVDMTWSLVENFPDLLAKVQKPVK
jgi:hypothetical protein